MREYLIKHRILLDDLFVAARNTLACLFNDSKYRKNKNKHKNDLFYRKHQNKSKYAYKDDKNKVVFGAVMTLHTFGRNLQWNPHIHCLVCEEAYDTKKNKIKNFAFMSYEKLRKTWMYQVLDIISPKLGDDFQRLKKDLYRICKDGFYIWAKPDEKNDNDDVEKCVQYITRYTSRPPMAESRIVSYDPLTKHIHWFYHRHEDDKRIDVHEHVYNFLNHLILHCPEKNFRMTRYYGYYSNKNRPLLEKIYELYGKKKKKRKIKTSEERKKLLKRKLDDLKYRCHMIQSYCKDPILCTCGEIMKPSGQYNPFEGGKKMTDDTETKASEIWENWSEEEILEFLGPRDTYIRMKCSRCGYEENVPDWVYGEFRGEDIATGKSNRETAIECPKCNGAMFKKK